MKTLNHKICPVLQSRIRKIIGKAKMSSMRLIYDQRDSMPVCDTNNFFNIRNNSVIRRRRDQHCFCFRILFQHFTHLPRINSSIQSRLFLARRNKIMNLKSPQISCMINRFMAISCHKQSTISGSTCRNCTQQSCRTSIHQIKALFCPIKSCRSLLCLLENPFCMMKIIKSINLCYIDLIWIIQSFRAIVSFMARHMKWITVTLAVFI